MIGFFTAAFAGGVLGGIMAPCYSGVEVLFASFGLGVCFAIVAIAAAAKEKNK